MFAVDGIVVDGIGRPVVGARITARDRTVASDQAGCFHAFLVTSPVRHTISVTIEAKDFASSTGELPSPGDHRVRITASPTPKKFADIADVNPPKGSLGLCEPRSPSR
jgi:hypothetical protein